jgi:2-polyprenyl-6-hydroxyphenyl methylase/3-demethylubiquinone-9 3-methyltransferase
MRLHTTTTRDHADVAAFFDANAPSYHEQHGDAGGLLLYRLELLRSAAQFRAQDEVLEIGCGNGLHLLALATEFSRGLGVDLSPGMVRAAREKLAAGPWGHEISFAVDSGETLGTVPAASVDVLFCVGSLEHMLDHQATMINAFRVLRPGGRLVCLTLHGGSLWYRFLAPALGIHTRRLSTDHYLSKHELGHYTLNAGFQEVHIDHWTFIQQGDIPRPVAVLLCTFDRIGRFLHLGFLRGGLRLSAIKPIEPESRISG